MAPMRRLLATNSPAEIAAMRAAGLFMTTATTTTAAAAAAQEAGSGADLAVTADDLLAALAHTKPTVGAREAARHMEWEAALGGR